jgi:hypothetical protein
MSVDVCKLLTAVSEYCSLAVNDEEKWVNWTLDDATEVETLARKLPTCQGVKIPSLPLHGYDPFSMSLSAHGWHERTTWLLTKTFAYYSERALLEAGFTPQGAKLLTYFRICLIANGCGSEKEEWAGIKASYTQGAHPIRADCPALDTAALFVAKSSWAVLTLTVLAAYVDSGYRFSEATISLCEATWARTAWPKLLEEYDLEWAQIVQCIAKSFSPRALLLAVVQNILVGEFPQAPIFDVVHYTVVPEEAMIIISPWGPTAATIWWKMFTAHASATLRQRRRAIEFSLKDLGPDFFEPKLIEWVTTDMNPFLDLLRIMAPIILKAYRPMYMPHLSSTLYLDYNNDDLKLQAHAKAFAELVVSNQFNQDSFKRSSFEFVDLLGLDHWTNQQITNKVDNNVGDVVLQLHSPSPSEVRPWQFPSVSMAKVPAPDTLSVKSNYHLTTVKATEFTPMPELTAFIRSDSDSELSAAQVDDGTAIATMRALTTTEMGKDDDTGTALAFARTKLYAEDYTDAQLIAVFEGHPGAIKMSRFFRPELTKAKAAYLQALNSNWEKE